MDIKLDNKQELRFCADVCSLLQDIDTIKTTLPTLIKKQSFIPSFTKIRSLDGISSGETVQALVIECRYPENKNVHNIYVIFRGSGIYGREGWILLQNSHLSQMLLNGPTQPDNVCVHTGLLRMYRSIQKDLRSMIKHCPPITRVVMSGFGAGAAVAHIAALDIAWNSRLDPYHLDVAVKTITFGTPLFANKQFNKLKYDMCVGGDISYAIANDPICKPIIVKAKTIERTSPLTHWIDVKKGKCITQYHQPKLLSERLSLTGKLDMTDDDHNIESIRHFIS